jgi:hypothetical protein
LDKEIERMMKKSYVVGMTEQSATFRHVSIADPGLEFRAQTTVTSDQQVKSGVLHAEARKHLNKNVEPLLGLEASHGANYECVTLKTKGTTNLSLDLSIAPKGLGVDAILHNRHGIGTSPEPKQFIANLA